MPARTFSPLRRLLIGGLLASVASALLPWSEAIADDAKTLRIGYQKFNSINILKGSGALEKALAPQGVNVSWHEFAAGPQLLEALSTGAIDLGHAADAPSVFAQAAGKPVVYLAAEQPYPRGIGLVVREQDLKGKRVATGRGWNAQYLLAVALEQAGLSYQDITPAYVNNAADAVAALQSGSVQAVTLWDPFLAAAESQPGLKNLRDGSGLSNNRTFYLSTASYADQHRALLKTFFTKLGQRQASRSRRAAGSAAGYQRQRVGSGQRTAQLQRRGHYPADRCRTTEAGRYLPGPRPDSTQAAGGRCGLPGFRVALSGARRPCLARSASTPSA